MRENGAFSPDPKVRAHVPQDAFLQNNKFLVGEKINAPRGGACQGEDTSIFFPQHAEGRYTKQQLADRQKAVTLCRSCNIREKCLMYSLEYEPQGIWGGFPEQVRALLGRLWNIENKRTWKVRSSFIRYRKVIDYIVHPEDIAFIKKVAHDKNLAQPPFDERSGLSAAARRRISQGVADPIS
jgi:hypothetical protein